jgi:hypothetical protein
MEAVRTSETSINFNVTTRHYIPEDSKLHTRHRENLKSRTNRLNCTEQSSTCEWLNNFREAMTCRQLYVCNVQGFILHLPTTVDFVQITAASVKQVLVESSSPSLRYCCKKQYLSFFTLFLSFYRSASLFLASRAMEAANVVCNGNPSCILLRSPNTYSWNLFCSLNFMFSVA